MAFVVSPYDGCVIGVACLGHVDMSIVANGIYFHLIRADLSN